MELAIADTQTCRTCGETKPITEFDVRADTGKRITQCKDCRRKYQNERNARLYPREPKPLRVAGTTELLRCTRCGELKVADAFPRKERGEPDLQGWCRACFAEVKATRYASDPQPERDRARKSRKQREADVRQRLDEALRPCECYGCGEKQTALLVFEHPQEGAKTIAALVHSGWSWARISVLIATSTVRCRRCRRPVPRDLAAPRVRTPSRATLNDTAAGRVCPRCGELRPFEEFAPRYRGLPRPSTYCRRCQSDYHKEWYAANRTSVIARVAANRALVGPREARKIVYLDSRLQRWHYLLEHPCVDCGERDPIVLEFDHRSGKRAGISEMMRASVAWSEIVAEIQKCDVRCANCHRRRTADARNYYQDLRDPVRRATAPEARRLRWEYLLAHPCVDCGEDDPIVLEFDHRSGKRAAIVDLMRNHANWATVLAEIEKCDVRCANCHKRRTARTRNYYMDIQDVTRIGEAALAEMAV